MKKVLIVVAVAAVIFGGVIVVLNMIPTHLSSEGSQYLRGLEAEAASEKRSPLPSLEENDQRLTALADKTEPEKLQGLQEATQIFLQRIKEPTNLQELRFLLEGLVKNMTWAKEQKWTLSGSTKLAVLQSEVREVVGNRHAIVMAAIEAEMRDNLLSMKSLEITDGGVFFDGPDTMNTYYEKMSERRDNIGCIEDYNCVPLCGRGDCWSPLPVAGNFLTDLRNPKGKKILGSFAGTDTAILNLEPVLKQLDDLTLLPGDANR